MVLPFTTRFRTARVAAKRAGEDWDQIGDQALFYWDSVVSIPRAIKHYKKETLRLIAEGVAPAWRATAEKLPCSTICTNRARSGSRLRFICASGAKLR